MSRLLPQHASVPLALNQWRGENAPEWRREAEHYRDTVAAWVDAYEAREGARETSE